MTYFPCSPASTLRVYRTVKRADWWRAGDARAQTLHHTLKMTLNPGTRCSVQTWQRQRIWVTHTFPCAVLQHPVRRLVAAVAAVWNGQFKGRRHLPNYLQLSVCSACAIWWIRDVETQPVQVLTALTKARWDPGERTVYLLLQKTCLVYSLEGLGHPSRRLSGAFCFKFYAIVGLADNHTR